MTASFDETVKVWDTENGQVTFIAERKFQSVSRKSLREFSKTESSRIQGRINSCVSNPDFPFTFAVGGQTKGIQIWDSIENANGKIKEENDKEKFLVFCAFF